MDNRVRAQTADHLISFKIESRGAKAAFDVCDELIYLTMESSVKIVYNDKCGVCIERSAAGIERASESEACAEKERVDG
jgi:hypothetical protein